MERSAHRVWRVWARAALLFEPARLRRIAAMWAVLGTGFATLYTILSFSNGANQPFGIDYPTFAVAARLALHGHVAEVYDFVAFRTRALAWLGRARDPSMYQFSYPPYVMLLTAPLGAMPLQAGLTLWLAGGWAVFALCVRRMMRAHWLIYAAAVPAVLVNTITGQNGTFIAAFVGWGLLLLPKRPAAGGAVLALALCKPHLAFLLPVALAAGAPWRALASFIGAGAALAGAATLAYGPAVWGAWVAHGGVVQAQILGNGEGFWPRMLSVLVLARHPGGLSLGAAYAVQACATALVAAIIAFVWRGDASRAAKNTVLVLGLYIGAPYAYDYDLVAASLVPIWLMQIESTMRAKLCAALLVFAPFAVLPMARHLHAAAGGALLLPAFTLAAKEEFFFEKKNQKTFAS